MEKHLLLKKKCYREMYSDKRNLPCKLALWRLAAANKAPRRFAPVNSHLPRQNKINKNAVLR